MSQKGKYTMKDLPFKFEQLGLLPRSIYTYKIGFLKAINDFYEFDSKSCEKLMKLNVDEELQDSLLAFLSQLVFDGQTSRFWIISAVIKRLDIFPTRFWRKLKLIRARKGQNENKVYITKEEMIKILNSINRMDIYLVALFQFFLGLRAGEALNLKFNIYKRLDNKLKGKYKQLMGERYIDEKDSLYLENGKFYLSFVGKGNKKYTIQIPFQLGKEVLNLLNEIVKKEIEPVLDSEIYYKLKEKIKEDKDSQSFYQEYYRMLQGKYLWCSYVTYWGVLKKTAIEVTGKVVKTHDLRRSFGRITYNEKKDIILVRDLLRHKSVSTTQLYIGDSDAKERVNVLTKLYGGESDEIVSKQGK